LGIVCIVTRQKLRHRELRQQVARDIRVFFQRVTHVRSKKNAKARPFVPLPLWRIPFFVGSRKTLTIAWSWAASRLTSLTLFLLPHAKRLPRRFRKGFVFFTKDLLRVVTALGRFLLHKTKALVKNVRQDLRTFELPKHKEDFFDRLQQEEQRKEKGDDKIPSQVRKKVISEEPLEHDIMRDKLSLQSATAPKEFPIAIPSSLADEKKDAPIFQSQKVLVTHLPEEHVDLPLFQKKEEQLLLQIMKNPKNPSGYKKLGKVYLQIDNWKDARKCFEHAIKLGARDPELQQLLAQTQKGA